MEHGNCTGQSRKGKHLTKAERVVIERMTRAGYPALAIADTLGRHQRTIEREIGRGCVEHKDTELRIEMVYSSDRGQDVHDLNATAKGPQLKLGANREMVTYVHSRIVDHRESPAVVAFRMRNSDMIGAVCAKTLYTYIDHGLIEGVSNESLWEKRQRRHRTKRVIRHARKAPTRRQSIEKRPEHIQKRDEFGHWEIDLIAGPTEAKATLMTLVERKTRKLIIRKLKDKTHGAVRRAINSIERKYGGSRFRDIFKSITADNGSEFLDVDGMQNSVFSATPRTALFYAHPYSSWERGTNENTNRIIRRFIAKGRKIESLTCATIRTIEEWINNYPRKIIDFSSSNKCFETEMEAIAA
jgi:IS30 family transposase